MLRIAFGLIAALAITSRALADTSPPCDVARPASWQLPAIDPEKDLIGLVEKGYDTTSGQHVMPHVLAIKDISASPFEDEHPVGRRICYAIVETGQQYQENAIYKFWYVEIATGSVIHALHYRDLERQLPDDIKIANAAPYLFTADALINKYIILATGTAPNCKLRGKAWSQALLAKVLEAVRRDRPDRLVVVKRIIAEMDAASRSPYARSGAYAAECKDPETKVDIGRADGVIAGNPVWGDPYDRRD